MDIYRKYEDMKFCSIVPNTKRPYNWDDSTNTFTQEPSNPTANIIKWSEKPLKLDQVDGRPGVLGGYGGYVIIDIDKNADQAITEIKKYLPITTLVVESGKSTQADRRYHLYYKIKNPDEFIFKRKHDYGEIIWFGGQVVGAGNIHPDTKRPYTVCNEVEIEEIDALDINRYLNTTSTTQTNQNQEDYNIIQVRNSTIIRNILDNKKIREQLADTPDISKNDVLFKNMAIFAYFNKDYMEDCISFVEDCGHLPSQFEGWVKKASTMSINEQEIKKWIIDNQLEYIFVNEDNYDGLDIINEKDVLDWEEVLNPLVKDLVFENTLNMIYAPPSSFKSFLSLYMAMCIASGKPFLGLETKQSKVLYLDKENPKFTYKNRFNGLMKGTGINTKNKLFTYRSGDILDDQFVIKLKATIKKYKIKVLIFDTLHRFGNYNEDKADDINNIYVTCFQPLIEELGCTIIFLHHTTKGDGGNYRGSSDLEGMCDGILSFERIKDSNGTPTQYLKMRQKKIRNKEEEDDMICELVIETADNNNIVNANFVISDGGASKTKKEVISFNIVKALREEPCSRAELIARLKIHAKEMSTFDKVISQLKENGDINIVNNKYHPNKQIEFK